MLTLQLIALLFLALSVAFCFGPRLVVYGPRAFGQMMRQGLVQFVGCCLTSILVVIVMAPNFSGVGPADSGALPADLLDAIALSSSMV